MHHRIEAYRFGLISVDGYSYARDLIVLPDRVIENWMRIEGHRLHASDLDTVLAGEDIRELIVGTGKFGIMKIDDDVSVFMDQHDIVLYAHPTSKAVELYNEKDRRGVPVAGAFHLTC